MTGSTRALLLVTAGNLLPLVLVATGSLDLPLLLVCYGIEAVLLPADPDDTLADTLKLRAIAALVGLILLVRALAAVSWSPGTVLVLVATVAMTLGGTWAARRDPRATDTPGGIGAVLWRLLVLLVGGVVALSYAQDLTVLQAHGWVPESVGHTLATGPARAFNELVHAFDLAPLTAAALVLVAFKTVNEGLWTAIRSLSPARPARR